MEHIWHVKEMGRGYVYRRSKVYREDYIVAEKRKQAIQKYISKWYPRGFGPYRSSPIIKAIVKQP
jgi:hypothetical protein